MLFSLHLSLVLSCAAAARSPQLDFCCFLQRAGSNLAVATTKKRS
jgi:hypothetical protein